MSRTFPVFLCLAALFVTLPIRAQDTERQFLSGQGKDDAVPWEFRPTIGGHAGSWTNLPVPSEWDAGRKSLPSPPSPANLDDTGYYVHEFVVPEAWAGRRILLVFEGVLTDAEVRLNGRMAGPRHQGGFGRFQYEVTSLVQCGAINRLEVGVASRSANASINAAEHAAGDIRGGGIYRLVYLEAVPAQFIERVAIDAQADGRFSAEVHLNGATKADEIEAQIQTLGGTNVGGLLHSGTASMDLLTHAEFSVLRAQITAPHLIILKRRKLRATTRRAS